MLVTLRVGLDHAPPIPIQIGHQSPDGGPGTLHGYEIALLDELALRLNAGLHYRTALWSTLISELRADRLDLVCSAATVTADRSATVAFCTPHLHLSLAVVKRLRTDSADPTIDMTTSRIGVRSGTTAKDYLETHSLVPTRISESNDELYAAVAAGQIDAVIDDSPIAQHFARTVPGLSFAGSIPHTEAAYAIMVNQSSHELRDRINDALAELTATGRLAQLRKQWLPGLS